MDHPVHVGGADLFISQSVDGPRALIVRQQE